jgi:hypothetical protein
MFFEWTLGKLPTTDAILWFRTLEEANAKKTIHLEANFFKVILLGNYRS